LTGRRVGGEEAVRLGLCDVLVDDAVLLERAMDRAAAIAASGPLAVRSIRQTLHVGLLEQLRLAMEHECAEQERLRTTADFAEGLRASAERREPNFTGE
jgi:2-(1,2-epoxy-1,2-dihydrophenyl)acetyl-CoA isomerase